MSNPFFRNHGPFLISDVLKFLNIKISNINLSNSVNDIKDLSTSQNDDITFFHSKKYKEAAKNTKASFCITFDRLKNYLPKKCIPLVVDNVLVSVSKLTENIYPDSVNDDFDETATDIIKTNFKILLYMVITFYGENVKIGSNCLMAIIPSLKKISIGDNCSIG